MSEHDPLASSRELKAAARANVMDRYARLRGGLADKGIGQRLTDHAKGKVSQVAGEACEIAAENKGVIAGTFVVLIGWLFRKPLGTVVQGLWPRIRARFVQKEGE